MRNNMRKLNKAIVYLTGVKERRAVELAQLKLNNLEKVCHLCREWQDFASAVLQLIKTRKIKIKKPQVQEYMQKCRQLLTTEKTVENHFNHSTQSH